MQLRFHDDRRPARVTVPNPGLCGHSPSIRWWLVAVAALAAMVAAGCSAEGPNEAPAAPSIDAIDAAVPDLRLDEHALRRRAEVRARAARAPAARVVLLGDSITERWERVGAPVFEASIEPWGVANLGVDGDRTEHVLGRLDAGELDGFTPELVVLMIGANNLWRDPPEAIVAGVDAIVDRVHRARPEASLWLLALHPWGFDPASTERRAVDRANAALSRAARDWPVRFIDLGAVFVERDGSLSRHIAPDGLHLSEAGYARWAEALAPLLEARLGPAP